MLKSALAGFGFITIVACSFVAGIAATVYTYGKNPELGHATVNHMDEVINGVKEEA